MKITSAIICAVLWLVGSLSATPVVVKTDTTWKITGITPAAGWNTEAAFNDSTFTPAIVNGSSLLVGEEMVSSIWDSSKTNTGSSVVWLRKVFTVDAPVLDGTLDIYVSDDVDFFINGTLVASERSGNPSTFYKVNIAPYLVAGTNLFAAKAIDNAAFHLFQSRAVINADPTTGGEPAGASFTPIGLGTSTYAYDANAPQIRAMTPDGTIFVGSLRGSNGSSRAFVRRNGKSFFLPSSSNAYTSTSADAVSDDGTVIVGSQAGKAVRWVNGGLPQYMGDLPNSVTATGAPAISADGSIIVGYGSARHLFRWTEATGVQSIPLPANIHAIVITGMSRDGAVIYADGYEQGDFGDQTIALRWTSSEGLHALDVPSGAARSHVGSVADDGSAVGYWDDNAERHFARWDSAGVRTELPAPAGLSSSMTLLSADGTTSAVSGYAYRSTSVRMFTVIHRLGQTPVTLTGIAATAISPDGSILAGGEMIWDSVNGLRRIKQLLFENYGVFTARHWLFGGWKGFIHQGGGKVTVASMARSPQGGYDGWIATIPDGVESSPFSGAMLAKKPNFVPTASLAENYAERTKDMGDHTGFYADWNAKLTVVGSIAGIDPATIGANTAVTLMLGDFVFNGKLGDASDFTAGKTKATFPLSDGNLIVSWKGDVVTYNLNCSLSSTRSSLGFQSINWVAYRGLLGGESFRDESRRLVTRFGDVTGNNTVFFSGSFSSRSIYVNDGYDALDGTKLAGGIDYTRPTVSYVHTPNNALSLASRLNVVFKSVGVQGVTVRINGGAPVAATNVLDPIAYEEDPDLWEVTLSLVPGENRIEVIATDAAGNESVLVSRTVVHNPVQGTYVGVITDANGDVVGQANLKMTAAGGLSGKLIVAGATYGIKDTLDGTGAAVIEIARRNLPKLTLDLHLTISPGTNTLAATLTEEGNPSPWALDARRILYDAKVNPAPQAGYYTAVLPGDSTQPATPQGSGFATLRVSNTGAVAVVGKVADGRAFSASGTLDGDNRLALYAQIAYAKAKGHIGGVISIVPDLNMWPALPNGPVAWHKPAQTGTLYPAEFTARCNLDGSPYTPGYTDRANGFDWHVFNAVLDFPGAMVAILNGGALPGSITVPLTLSMPSKISASAATSTRLKLTLGNTTGLITGSFVPPGETKARKIFGIAQQSLNVGAGFFTGDATTGKIEIKYP